MGSSRRGKVGTKTLMSKKSPLRFFQRGEKCAGGHKTSPQKREWVVAKRKYRTPANSSRGSSGDKFLGIFLLYHFTIRRTRKTGRSNTYLPYPEDTKGAPGADEMPFGSTSKSCDKTVPLTYRSLEEWSQAQREEERF